MPPQFFEKVSKIVTKIKFFRSFAPTLLKIKALGPQIFQSCYSLERADNLMLQIIFENGIMKNNNFYNFNSAAFQWPNYNFDIQQQHLPSTNLHLLSTSTNIFP